MTDDLVLSDPDSGGTTLLSGDAPSGSTLVLSVTQPQDGTQSPATPTNDTLQFVETLVAAGYTGTAHYGATPTEISVGALGVVATWIADVDCTLTGISLTGEGDCTWHLTLAGTVQAVGQLSGRAKSANVALPSAVAVTAGQDLVLTAMCSGIGPCTYEGVIYTEVRT